MLLTNPMLWTSLTIILSAGPLAGPPTPDQDQADPEVHRTLEAFVQTELLAARDPDDSDYWRDEAQRWRQQAEMWERKAREAQHRVREWEQERQRDAERDERAALEDRRHDVHARMADIRREMAELDEEDREWRGGRMKLEVLEQEAQEIERRLQAYGPDVGAVERKMNEVIHWYNELHDQLMDTPAEDTEERERLRHEMAEAEQAHRDLQRVRDQLEQELHQEEHSRRLDFERQELEMMHYRLEHVVGWEEVAFQPERALVMAVQSIVELSPDPHHAVKALEHLLKQLPERRELAGPRTVVRFALKEAYLQLDLPEQALQQMVGVVEENAEVLGH